MPEHNCGTIFRRQSDQTVVEQWARPLSTFKQIGLNDSAWDNRTSSDFAYRHGTYMFIDCHFMLSSVASHSVCNYGYLYRARWVSNWKTIYISNLVNHIYWQSAPDESQSRSIEWNKFGNMNTPLVAKGNCKTFIAHSIMKFDDNNLITFYYPENARNICLSEKMHITTMYQRIRIIAMHH